MKISRINNFDLLRLLASIQVVIWHTAEHLNINLYFFHDIIKYFPGVPIFFAISGFLIFRSLNRNPDLKKYFKNRFLRIYPALWVCLLVTVALLFIFKTIDFSAFKDKSFLTWLFGQITIFQYYTPDLLRSWGVGTPNGSLWTIPVEIEFYLVLPLIVLLFKRISLNLKLLIFSILSIGINMYFGTNDTTLVKLINVSVFPYLYCFLFGVFLSHNWNKIKRFIEGKALYWFLAYAGFSLIFGEAIALYRPIYHANLLGFASYFILSCLIISSAYTNINLSEKLIKHNDISYGVYIYHMLVVNSFLALGLKGEMWMLLAVVVITSFIAFLSWRYVERFFLNLKNK